MSRRVGRSALALRRKQQRRDAVRRRRELTHAGQSVQVDVKHLKLGAGRFYQFTAIDERSSYRVLKIYAQRSAADCPSRFSASRPTTAANSGPTSRGICAISGLPIATSRRGARRVTAKLNVAIEPARKNSTGVRPSDRLPS